jgi:ankyrin repeat protein
MIAGSDAVLSEADKLKYARLNSPVARMISGCVQANTALLNAASSGNLLGVQAALETRRADVNVQRACEEWPGEEKSYNAPLHYAAGKNRLEIVRVLVSAGADPDKRDAGGNTPLHVAALANDTDENKKILEILVSAGADPTAQNKAGRTPADYAKAVRKAEIFTMVCSAVLMQVAGIKAQLKYVQALLAAGADVRASNRHGLTALHLAAAGGCTIVVKALLGAGASVNAQDTQGQTALHLAVLELREMAVQRAIVEALLKAGADPALADEHDMTALALAEARGLPADLIEDLKKAAGKIAADKAAVARCATSLAGPSPRGFFSGSGEEKAEARESRAGVTAVLTGST